jgi:hypothetical protein
VVWALEEHSSLLGAEVNMEYKIGVYMTLKLF